MAIGAKINQIDGSKHKSCNMELFNPTEPKYTFDDIIIPIETLDQIKTALALKEHSDLIFNKWGLSQTHKNQKKNGINLYGPPGTGKTMTAHAISNHLKRNLITVNYAEIESKYVGETAKNLVKLFRVAKSTNSILFFDEADAILSKRVTGMRHSTDVSVNQTRSVLLMQINEHEDTIIYATNFIENFDPAFMRRISSHIQFKLPDENCIKRLFEKLIPSKLPNNIDIKYFASKYQGISGSDISNAIFLSALQAAQSKKYYVTNAILESKLNQIINSNDHNREKISIRDKLVSKTHVEKELSLK